MYGVIISLPEGGWRAPRDGDIPKLQEGKHLFFTSWLDHGFTPPGLNCFMICFTYYFQLRPQYITPKSLMHMPMFTVLYESYLGTEPYLPLVRYLFQCKARKEKAGVGLGSVVVSLPLGDLALNIQSHTFQRR
jgi:hypothetical protein